MDSCASRPSAAWTLLRDDDVGSGVDPTARVSAAGHVAAFDGVKRIVAILPPFQIQHADVESPLAVEIGALFQ